MSDGLNKVMLLGNLGQDPELRYTQGGQAVLNLRIATNESYLNKDGQRQERTEWHAVIIWGKRGEGLSKVLSKGKQIFVEGRLQTRSWEDKQGNKRYTTEIVANDVVLLGGGGGGGGGRGRSAAWRAAATTDARRHLPTTKCSGGGRRGGGGAGGRRGGGGEGGGGGGGGFGDDDDIPF